MDKDKRKLFIVFAVLAGVLLFTSAAYAWFSYGKQGVKQNTIRSGKIEFLYTEVDGIGAGISLEDAMPMTDPQGMAQVGTNGRGYFDFKITSSTARSTAIPYTVTARVKGDSTLDPSVVKVFLTDPNTEEPVDGYTTEDINTGNTVSLAKYFSEPSNSTGKEWLSQYTGVGYAANYTEKVLYSGLVPAGSSNPKYERDFRLRIWVADDTDFSPVEVTKLLCDGNEVDQAAYDSCSGVKSTQVETEYPYNGKTFTITVNVYANGEAVSDNYTASQIEYTTSYNANIHSVADALDDLTNRLGN